MADMQQARLTPPVAGERTATLRTWGICGLMLLATMLNYMDRQALAQQATEISRDLVLSNENYARLEAGFGLAFAIGGIVSGLLVDRVSPRWLYPLVLLGWSTIGFATGSVRTYQELLFCRVALGFFEAGQWPCALVTAQRMLARRDRTLGNGIIQSGASLGAIATPLVVMMLTDGSVGSWRLPFRVIGALGALWIIAWLASVRSGDLQLNGDSMPELAPEPQSAGSRTAAETPLLRGWLRSPRATFLRRFLAVAIVVVTINLCFQFFRAWMPKMLREEHGYDANQVQAFSSAFYMAADAGCLAIGFLVKWLVGRGQSVHHARMATFLACALLTTLSTVAAFLPPSWLLLAILLVIGFGSLGQFPNYYAFTQELSARRMGNITGVLSFTFWLVYAFVQEPIGRWIDHTQRFSQVMFVAGLLPLIGFLALAVFWGKATSPATVAQES
jgi:ACS family hexuronate transporter-like MFS transporter